MVAAIFFSAPGGADVALSGLAFEKAMYCPTYRGEDVFLAMMALLLGLGSASDEKPAAEPRHSDP